MRIGFDLDGVIASQNKQALIFLHKNNASTGAWKEYFKHRRPQLDPAQFLFSNDEIYIITSREKCMRDVTEEWLKNYLDIPFQLVMASVNPRDYFNEKFDNNNIWFDNMARAKAQKINQLQIDVYFEDFPLVVSKLRELCPKCKIIQFGGT